MSEEQSNNKETKTFVAYTDEYADFCILCEYLGYEYSGKIRSLIREFLNSHAEELKQAKERLNNNV